MRNRNLLLVFMFLSVVLSQQPNVFALNDQGKVFYQETKKNLEVDLSNDIHEKESRISSWLFLFIFVGIGLMVLFQRLNKNRIGKSDILITAFLFFWSLTSLVFLWVIPITYQLSNKFLMLASLIAFLLLMKYVFISKRNINKGIYLYYLFMIVSLVLSYLELGYILSEFFCLQKN